MKTLQRHAPFFYYINYFFIVNHFLCLSLSMGWDVTDEDHVGFFLNFVRQVGWRHA